MKIGEKAGLFVSLGLMGSLVCSCAAKNVETTEAPKAPETQVAAKVEVAQPAPTEKYVVKMATPCGRSPISRGSIPIPSSGR